MLKKYLPTRLSKGRCLFLVGFMLFMYILNYLPLNQYIDYKIINYILKPALWISLALVVWSFPRIRCKSPLRQKANICWWALIFAVVYVVAQGCAGLIDGFGKSPYDHSLKGILLNILMIGAALIGREFARSYIVNTFAKEEKFLVFIIIALFMTFLGYPINKFTNLKGLEETVKFIAQYWAPDFCLNLFATYLAFLGGFVPALIYMAIQLAFNWLSPILPNLKWITAGLVGIICPVFSLTAMQNIFLKETKKIKKSQQEKESPAGWMITSILSIAIIWFSVGVFPVYPSVIATGSMEPMIMPGDVILIEKVKETEEIKELKVGDVIQFKNVSENILISHRIIQVVGSEKEKSFRTKGDNNNSEDRDLVLAGNIKGKIIKVVPKIGWPTLLIKKKNDVPLEKVVF